MKTAMQQLIEWVDKDLKLLGYEHQQIIDKATELLEVEKQQIRWAFNNGALENGPWNIEYENAQKYYQKTFNQ